MKYAGVLFVFIVSLVLVSCSSLDQENPTSSQLHKPNPDSFVYPYDYLTEFQEVVVKDYFRFNDVIRVTVPEIPFKVEQIFAIVEYSANPDFDYPTSTMVFVGNPRSNEFTIGTLGDKEISGLKIFALPQRNIPDLVTEFPYEISQKFNELTVTNWSSAGQFIKISSDEVENVAQTFAEITCKAGKILVYIDKPETNTFEIPKFGDLGVTGVKLFGYSGPEDRRTNTTK